MKVLYAPVAQEIEHRSSKALVVGANPTRGVRFSGGTVDTADLESAALKSVEVQIFSGALGLNPK